MVLILRPEDHKILSISRKKVYCHEMMYAKFDAETQTRPRIDFKDFTLDTDEVDAAIQKARELGERNRQSHPEANSFTNISADTIPPHVLSVKALSDAKRNQHFLTPDDRTIPSEMIKTYHEAEGSGECSKCSKLDVPETLKFRGDLPLDDLKRMMKSQDSDTLSESIVKAIKTIDDEKGDPPIRGMLKRGLRSRKKTLDPENVVDAKRLRTMTARDSKEIKGSRDLEKKTNTNLKSELKAKAVLPELKKNDRVKILTTRFGKGYAKGLPKWAYGKVVGVSKEKIVDVEWDSSGKG